jgi:predicted RNase H-like nuclease (RuvC/YqgF family)
LRGGLKRMAEEKAIIQENASNCLKIAQEEG